MTREDFIPENIGKLLYAEHPEDIVNIGSYAWFKDIEGFTSHDYDYDVYMKSDHNEILKYHYMYCDYWVIYFKENQTVEEFVYFIMDTANTYPAVVNKFICKNKNPYFNITYADIEPYLETIKEKMACCTNKYPKMIYLGKILEYMIENQSMEITDAQLKDVYQIYLENKYKQLPKGIERREIPKDEHIENNET